MIATGRRERLLLLATPGPATADSGDLAYVDGGIDDNVDADDGDDDDDDDNDDNDDDAADDDDDDGT